jgi:perosamine synthetase
MRSVMTKDLATQAPEHLPATVQTGEEAREPLSAAREAAEPLTAPGIYTFWRGRVALYAILKSLGVGAGDSVLVPGYTCFAVPAAVLFTGALPLYMDIDSDAFNVTVESAESAWKASARNRIKAIVIQHTFGLPANLPPILAWAREHGVATVEDCAHCWGSRYLNEHGEWTEVGTAADAAFYSSQWTKPISTGLGGWARINNPDLEAGMRRFYTADCVAPSAAEVATLAGQVFARSFFSSPWAHWTVRSLYQWLYMHRLTTGTSTPDELQGKMPRGYAKRMSGYQRRLLQERLRNSSVQAHRRRLKNLYDAALESAGLRAFKIPDYADAVLLRYPIAVADKKRTLAQAERRRIELGDWYTHPIDRPQDRDAEIFAYRSGACPRGERAAREIVNLPMHSQVNERTVETVVEFLKEVA